MLPQNKKMFRLRSYKLCTGYMEKVLTWENYNNRLKYHELWELFLAQSMYRIYTGRNKNEVSSLNSNESIKFWFDQL